MSEYIYYNNSFYPLSEKNIYDAVNAWPESGVLVSQDVRDTFSVQFPEGKVLGANSEGYPEWIDAPDLTHNELVHLAKEKKARLREQADGEISWLQDAVSENIATAEEISVLSEWRTYRVLLMRIDINQAPDISWPAKPNT
ncbi:tail fiber assembly protein [Escherichia coli]|nr:tail fiber assembly protein [Escherichia coli]EFD6486731.1 tail fiber assembly protein [Escherichia coli]MDD9044871.1 tail fiber assembly protein [Escherichia coli]HAX2761358.1 tail fiber assembly protein [Escherichia coli]HBQ4573734.1 tail fiber assembly protein [Escherichia coli]